jgi:hypothetical protein
MREYVLGGGTLTPRQVRGRAKHAKAIDAQDMRFFDPRNCVPPGAARPLVAVLLTTTDMSRWTVKDIETIHAQFYVDVGHCPPEVRSVRLSQCGVYWWRNRQQENRPTHRFSWMHPRDDLRKGRNPSSFTSGSTRRVATGVGEPCEATLALFGHQDYRQQLQPTALSFSSAGSRAAMRFEGTDPPSPGAASPPPLAAREFDPDYFRGGGGDEVAAFLDQFT